MKRKSDNYSDDSMMDDHAESLRAYFMSHVTPAVSREEQLAESEAALAALEDADESS